MTLPLPHLLAASRAQPVKDPAALGALARALVQDDPVATEAALTQVGAPVVAYPSEAEAQQHPRSAKQPLLVWALRHGCQAVIPLLLDRALARERFGPWAQLAEHAQADDWVRWMAHPQRLSAQPPLWLSLLWGVLCSNDPAKWQWLAEQPRGSLALSPLDAEQSSKAATIFNSPRLTAAHFRWMDDHGLLTGQGWFEALLEKALPAKGGRRNAALHTALRAWVIHHPSLAMPRHGEAEQLATHTQRKKLEMCLIEHDHDEMLGMWLQGRSQWTWPTGPHALLMPEFLSPEPWQEDEYLRLVAHAVVQQSEACLRTLWHAAKDHGMALGTAQEGLTCWLAEAHAYTTASVTGARWWLEQGADVLPETGTLPLHQLLRSLYWRQHNRHGREDDADQAETALLLALGPSLAVWHAPTADGTAVERLKALDALNPEGTLYPAVWAQLSAWALTDTLAPTTASVSKRLRL